ncbi:unnamed protein product [Choristocarpus tenellus]
MGNAQSGTQKGTTAKQTPTSSRNTPDDSIVRDRFDVLAVDAEDGRRYVSRDVFTESTELLGPRGSQVSARLFNVLDSNVDGRLGVDEFLRAAYLLRGSSEMEKLKLLFDMYDGTKSGFMEREGLRNFLLDTIAASPPPLSPHSSTVDQSKCKVDNNEAVGPVLSGDPQPNFEHPLLESVLEVMVDAILSQYDADGDRKLSEKEWSAYLKSEEESTGTFLETLSTRAGNLFVP